MIFLEVWFFREQVQVVLFQDGAERLQGALVFSRHLSLPRTFADHFCLCRRGFRRFDRG